MPSERFAVAVLLAVAFAPVRAAAAPTLLSLDAATQRAVESDPELRALSAEEGAAQVAREASAALLAENPSLEAAAGPRRLDGESTLDLSVAVSQPIELAGQRAARREAADAQLGVTRARLAQRRASVVAEVREAFGRALASVERVALEESAVALASEALAATQERVRAGDAARLDENAAIVERARARREAESARRERDRELGALRVLLGLAPGEVVTLDGTLEQIAARSVAPGLGIPTAVGEQPEVTAAREDLRAARAQRALADREAVPDLRLGASYAREERADIVQGLVSIDLPLFQRNRTARAEAAARVTRADAMLEDASRRGAEGIRALLTRRDAARALAAESGGATLAAATENVTLANEAYAAGKAGFLELLLVRRDALEARRAHLDALVELNAAEAQVARAIPGR